MSESTVANSKLFLAALLASLAALAGSLWLSMGMELKACPLCFYQRTFVMSIAAVLVVGRLGRLPNGSLSLLSLPLASAGLGVALFHVYLELTGTLECPVGVLGVGTAPQQSLAALAVLFALLMAGTLRTEPGNDSKVAVVAGPVLGALLAVACVLSSPPLPASPAKPYEKPIDGCRPPFNEVAAARTL